MKCLDCTTPTALRLIALEQQRDSSMQLKANLAIAPPSAHGPEPLYTYRLFCAPSIFLSLTFGIHSGHRPPFPFFNIKTLPASISYKKRPRLFHHKYCYCTMPLLPIYFVTYSEMTPFDSLVVVSKVFGHEAYEGVRNEALYVAFVHFPHCGHD